MSSKRKPETTPPLKGTPPREGNKSALNNSPPLEGWQAKPDGVVPKLRFPEFRDVGEWENRSFYNLLDDVLDFRGRTPLKLGMEWGGGNIISLSANNVKNGYIDYDAECNLGSQALYEKWMEKVNLEKNDIVFTMEAPLGNALLIPDSDKYILSQRVVAFKTKKEVNNFFLIQLIWSNQFQNSIDKLATGSTAKGINQKSLKKVYVNIPSEGEQQKIADCLSSLDDRITAETQKLDTLKAHKIGLMQQLFPAEGETLPKLRFPEFWDAGEWREYQFGKLIKVNSGKGFKASEYSKHGIRLLQIENVGYGVTKWSDNTIFLPQNYSTEYPELVLREGAIVLALNRPVTNDELKIAQLQKEDEPSLLYQRVGKLKLLSDSVVEDFVFHICRTFIKDFVVKQSIGSDQPFISVTTLYAQIILIPSPEEQQKIAACLSSLDELITAQTQKIDTLKTHKKGLMQQLFPALDEVKG